MLQKPHNTQNLNSVQNRTESYRFGFQGQEAENELTGQTGSHSFFKYRISDNRIGRFFAIDPLTAKYPWNSPYAFSENKLIHCIELEGLESYEVMQQQNMGHASDGDMFSNARNSYREGGRYFSEKVAKYGGVGLAIVGGVIVIVASGGSASPLIASLGITGGTMQIASSSAALIINVVDDVAPSEKTKKALEVLPDSPLSFIALTLDVMVGNKKYTIKGVVELVEGLYQFKPSKVSGDLDFVSNALENITFTLGTKGHMETLDSLFSSDSEKEDSKNDSTNPEFGDVELGAESSDDTETE